VLAAIHSLEKPVRRVMIAGGGKVGLRLAKRLHGHCQVKIIERDRARCEHLATELPSDVLVLQGDCADEDLLTEENVGGHGPVPGADQRRRGQHPVGHAGQAHGRRRVWR
jgi:trk system potassium uptake protein TrkA